MGDDREWRSAVNSGSLLGILIVCLLCWRENQSLKGISHTAVCLWLVRHFNPLCFLKNFLACSAAPAFLGMSEEGEGKDAHQST